jgi:hypothetical protein
MPIRERQILITQIIGKVLNELPRQQKFHWLTNKLREEHSGKHYDTLMALFQALGGDTAAHTNKREVTLVSDSYFGAKYNFIFEFDESQHFSSYRLQTLGEYPNGLRLGYDLDAYTEYCRKYHVKADSYRKGKTAKDFPVGRTAQRAYFDTIRDFIPPLHGLNPTLRIAEFDVTAVKANDEEGQRIVKEILLRRLPLILPSRDLEEITI